MADTTDRRGFTSIAVVLCAVLLASVAVGFLLLHLLEGVSNCRVADGLGAVSTTGGIISGLSISGTAVLGLSGDYRKRVLARFGSLVHAVLFGGFFILVTSALLAALGLVWIEQPWPRWVLAFSTPLIFSVLVTTSLMISAAFRWSGPKKARARRSNPMS